MRWLLCHRVCWNFVQWICFIGIRVICTSLYLWSLPCNITSFWLLGYLAAVQVRKHTITIIDWEEFKDYSSDVHMQSIFSFLDRHGACFKEPCSNKGTHTSCRLRCALLVVLNQGHRNLSQAQLSFTLNCRNTQ